MLSSMRKMLRFTSFCTCPSICSPLKHSVVSNNSICGRRRPWSDCTDAVRIFLKVRSILFYYDEYFILTTNIQMMLNLRITPKVLCRSNGSMLFAQNITKTRLYNFDPLKPHFYIEKLGFIGVYIIFLISAQNIDCGYSLEPPRRGGSNVYPQSMFWAEIWKISEFFIWKFSFFDGKIFSVFK